MIRVFSQYVSPKTFVLIALESIVITLSMLCAVRLRFWADAAEFQAYTYVPRFWVQTLTVMALFQVCFYLNDLYDLKSVMRDQALRLVQAIGAASLLLGMIYFVAPFLLLGRGVFFLNIVLVAAWILLSRLVLDRVWLATPVQNTLILGSGYLAHLVAQEIKNRRDLGFRVEGFLDCGQRDNGSMLDVGVAHLGSVLDLETIAARSHASRIVVALEDRRGSLPTAALVKLRVQGVIVEDAHAVIAALTGRVWLSTVRPSWFVFSNGFHRSRLTALIKRMSDLFIGFAGLVLSSPLMLLVALAVRLDSAGPILYKQVRVGWKGRTFEVLKFRSMRTDAESGGAQWSTTDDPRITRMGRYLRKFRLDELPQFVNVLRGDMSFVGPRPERPVFVDQLRQEIPYYDERHTVRPGLTGWAQVQYGYGATFEDTCRKLEYDLFYLQNMSLIFDCAIVLKTMRIILAGRHGR